jgi:hypothetical protein
MSRLKHRLCQLERKTASRRPAPSTLDQSIIDRQALLAAYIAAAECADLSRSEPLTPGEEREGAEVYEKLLQQARRR